MTKEEKLTELVEELQKQKEELARMTQKVAQIEDVIAQNKQKVGDIMTNIAEKLKNTEYQGICTYKIMREIYDCGKTVGLNEKAYEKAKGYKDLVESRCEEVWKTLYDTSKE